MKSDTELEVIILAASIDKDADNKDSNCFGFLSFANYDVLIEEQNDCLTFFEFQTQFLSSQTMIQ